MSERGAPDITELDTLRLNADRRAARLTFALLLIPTLWFIRTDLTMHVTVDVLGLRFAVRALFLLTLVFATWRLRAVRDRADYERLVLGASLIIAACIVGLNALRPQGSLLPLRTPLMWLFAYYGGLYTRPDRQVIAPLVMSGALIFLRCFWVTSGTMGTLDGDILVIVIVNVIGLLSVHTRATLVSSESALWRAERQARDSLDRTVSELQGLHWIIPICSYCREVRTEIGDWKRLEEYVRDRSEAQFSHGICPNCTMKHFPEATG